MAVENVYKNIKYSIQTVHYKHNSYHLINYELINFRRLYSVILTHIDGVTSGLTLTISHLYSWYMYTVVKIKAF